MIIIAGSISPMVSIIHLILAMRAAGPRQYRISHPSSVLQTGFVLNSSAKQHQKKGYGKFQQQIPATVIQLTTSPLQCQHLRHTWVSIFQPVLYLAYQRAQMIRFVIFSDLDVHPHRQHVLNQIGVPRQNATSNTWSESFPGTRQSFFQPNKCFSPTMSTSKHTNAWITVPLKSGIFHEELQRRFAGMWKSFKWRMFISPYLIACIHKFLNCGGLTIWWW